MRHKVAQQNWSHTNTNANKKLHFELTNFKLKYEIKSMKNIIKKIKFCIEELQSQVCNINKWIIYYYINFTYFDLILTQTSTTDYINTDY